MAITREAILKLFNIVCTSLLCLCWSATTPPVGELGDRCVALYPGGCVSWGWVITLLSVTIGSFAFRPVGFFWRLRTSFKAIALNRFPFELLISLVQESWKIEVRVPATSCLLEMILDQAAIANGGFHVVIYG